MPIDPKKFKEIVTNHFDNLSEEEFLETLRKSSPYLFDGSLEEKNDIKLSDQGEMNSQNIFSHILDLKSRYDRILAENYKDLTLCLEDEADRMKSDNIDPIIIKIYISKQKLIYTFSTVFQSVIYLTDNITKALTKRA